jgi:hypothetical protein
MILSAFSSSHSWHGGKLGSSKFFDAQTQLESVRHRSQKPFIHKYFHGHFAYRPHESWP